MTHYLPARVAWCRLCVLLCAVVLPSSTELSAQIQAVQANPVGLARPAAVVLDAHAAVTNASTIRLSGSVQPADAVEVFGPQGTFQVAVQNGRFAAVVPLRSSYVNQLHFTGIHEGLRGPTTTVRITQDLEAPELYVDGPADNSVVRSPTIDVFGRVGDRLSGSTGLAVAVNGQVATVHRGLGTNGTFFLGGLTLAPNTPTNLAVVATDVAGNQTTVTRTVTYSPVPAGTPKIEIASGNAQSGVVLRYLASPLTVRLTDANGAPFADKLVTFRVVRNDGVLQATSGGDPVRMLQVETDATGLARARLRLGAEAGRGINRVEVTATDFVGTVLFCADGTPGPVAQIAVSNMARQVAEAGGVTMEPLRVWVHDGCNGIGGVPVTFQVQAGGGEVRSGPNRASMLTVSTDSVGFAEVQYDVGTRPGIQRVFASFVGNLRGPAEFTITGLERGANRPTTFVGEVIDNAQRAIGGAQIHLTVNGAAVPTVATDVEGRFTIPSIPSGGPAVLWIEAKVATTLGGQPISAGTFPDLMFHPVVVANAENTLGEAIRIPPLDPNSWRVVDNTRDVELTVPGMAGLSFIIKAGSMSYRGQPASPSNPIPAAVNAVHFDEVPMPLPNGTAAPFAWTLQPSGATFDPPVEVRLPNMAGLPPGAMTYLFSYDHDTERFEIVASGSVTEDGGLIVSDPGSGIRTAGWGGFCPPYPNLGAMLRDLCGDAAVDHAVDKLKKQGRTNVTLEELVQELVEQGCGADGDSGQSNGQPPWSGDWTESHSSRSGDRLIDSDATRPNYPPPLQTPVSEQVPPWLDVPGTLGGDDLDALADDFGFERWGHLGEQSPYVVPQLVDRGWSPARIRAEHSAFMTNSLLPTLARMRQSGKLEPWVEAAGAALIPRITLQRLDSHIALARVLRPIDAGPISNLPALPPPLTGQQLTAPGVDAVTQLDVTASVGFFLSAGSQVQLRVVRKRDAADLTLGSTGTRYWVTDGAQVVSVSADGLVDIQRTSEPLANSLAKLWVYAQNGSDLGIGQFAIRDVDTDGDLLADSFERLVGLNPTQNPGPDGDFDSDGLRDLHECVIGTNPRQRDTDGDGVHDGDEIEQNSDPLNPRQRAPQLSDQYEVAVGAQRVRPSMAGSFRVGNLPVNTSPVRALMNRDRGLRARSGDNPVAKARFGRTEFFDIPAQRTYRPRVLAISEQRVPTPVRLTTTSSAPVLTQLGAKARLTTIAKMSVGPDVDVSDRLSGTRYTESAGGVVVVGPQGDVTALRRGVGFVTVTNEGATTVVPIVVAPGDPLTVVDGFVRLADQTPVIGAQVVVQPSGLSAVSDSDGRFVIRNVPTQFGSLSITATADVGGRLRAAVRNNIVPEPGMVTDVGVLLMTQGVFWNSDASGDWNDPTKWSGQAVPGPQDVAIVDRPGRTITVSLRTGNASVGGLICNERLNLISGNLEVETQAVFGDTVFVSAGASIRDTYCLGTGSIELRGGTLDGVRLAVATRVVAGSTVQNGLTLDRDMTVENVRLSFPGDQAIGGLGGRITLTSRSGSVGELTSDTGELTLGETITVTGSGSVGLAGSRLLVLGELLGGASLNVRAECTLRGVMRCVGPTQRIFIRGGCLNFGEIDNQNGALDVLGTMDCGGALRPLIGTLTVRGTLRNGGFTGLTGDIALVSGTLEDATLDVDCAVTGFASVRGGGFSTDQSVTIARGSRLRMFGAQQIGGSGAVVLGAGGFGLAELELTAGSITTIAPTATVRGTGRVLGTAAERLIILGTVQGSVAAQRLRVEAGWRCPGTLSVAAGGLLDLTRSGEFTGTVDGAAGTVAFLGGFDASGATPSVTGIVQVQGTVQNGTVRGTGSLRSTSVRLQQVTLDVPCTVNGFFITDRLTINADLTFQAGARSNHVWTIDGSQTLAGTGRVLMPGSSPWRQITGVAGVTWTIAAGVQVRGGGCTVSVPGLVVLGELACDIAGGRKNVSSSSWTNRGTLRAANGGALSFSRVGVSTGSLFNDGNGSELLMVGADLEGATVPVVGTLRMSGPWTNGTLVGSGMLDIQSGSLTNMTINLPAALVGARTLTIAGLTLNDQFAVREGTAQSATTLQFSGTQTLGGTGSVVLADGPHKRVSALAAADVITWGPGITVRGGGAFVTIRNLIVRGTVEASGSALRVGSTGGTYQNTGALRALAGGTLDLSGSWSGGGAVSAAAGATLEIESMDLGGQVLDLAGSLVSSGTIENGFVRGAGQYRVSTGRLRSLTIDAASVFTSGRSIFLEGLTVDRTLVVEEGPFNGTTTITFDGTQTLGGSGTVQFVGGSRKSMTATVNTTVTIGSGITVRGGGVNVSVLRFVNEGLVEATGGGNFTFGSSSTTGTHSGTFRATNGATLVVRGDWSGTGQVDVASGSRIDADGLDLSGNTLTIDGVLTTTSKLANVTLSGAGRYEARGGRVDSVVCNVPGKVLSGRSVTVAGLTTNDVFTVEDGPLTGQTRLTFDGTQTLAGSGELRMSPGGRKSVVGTAGTVLTIASACTLRGGGGVFSLTALVNDGTIASTLGPWTLGTSSGTYTNRGAIQVDSASQLTLRGAWAGMAGHSIQVTSGLLNVTEFDLAGITAIIDGELTGVRDLSNGVLGGSGIVRLANTVDLDGVQFGVETRCTQATLRVTGDLVVNDLFRLLRGSTGISRLQFQGAAPTLSGTGRVLMEAPQVTWPSGVLSLGAGLRIEGGGSLQGDVVLGGEWIPGFAGLSDQISVNGDLTLQSTARIRIDLGGLTPRTQHDLVAVTGAVTFGGTLDIALIGSYLPVLGNAFNVVTHSSSTGSFATTNGLTLPNNLALSPAYNSAQLRLTTVSQ